MRNNRIKEVIKERGFTISSLAEHIGVTRQTISSQLEKPSYPMLERFAEALGVEMWELFASRDEVHQTVCPHCGKPIVLRKP